MQCRVVRPAGMLPNRAAAALTPRSPPQLPQIAADSQGNAVGDLFVSDVLHKVYAKVREATTLHLSQPALLLHSCWHLLWYFCRPAVACDASGLAAVRWRRLPATPWLVCVPQVDESGTEAAAVTAIVACGCGAPMRRRACCRLLTAGCCRCCRPCRCRVGGRGGDRGGGGDSNHDVPLRHAHAQARPPCSLGRRLSTARSLRQVACLLPLPHRSPAVCPSCWHVWQFPFPSPLRPRAAARCPLPTRLSRLTALSPCPQARAGASLRPAVCVCRGARPHRTGPVLRRGAQARRVLKGAVSAFLCGQRTAMLRRLELRPCWSVAEASLIGVGYGAQLLLRLEVRSCTLNML